MNITYVSLPPMQSQNKQDYISPPTASGYLATFLQAKRGAIDTHDIIQVNEMARFDEISHFAKRAIKHSPQIIAISVYVWNYFATKEFIRQIRSLSPKVKIVVGGPEVCYTSAKAATDLEPDWICVSPEGEVPFLHLVQAIDKNLAFGTNLHGMLSAKSTKLMDGYTEIIHTPLNEIPPLYSNGLMSCDTPGWINFETQRGCPFACGYCVHGSQSEKVRQYPLDHIMRELTYLHLVGVSNLYFMDPTFNFNREHCLKICRGLSSINVNKKVQYSVEAKAELMDEEIANAFVEAGITAVEFGLQSINSSTLELARRNYSREKFEHGCKLLFERGIYVDIGIIVGMPGDDKHSILHTFDYLAKEQLGHVSVYRLMVLPGSTFRLKAAKYGLIYEEAPPHYIVKTPLLSNDEINHLSDSLFVESQAVNNLYRSLLKKKSMGSIANIVTASSVEVDIEAGSISKNETLSTNALPDVMRKFPSGIERKFPCGVMQKFPRGICT